MLPESPQPPNELQDKRNSRGKYITLVILLVWVFGVFIFTLFNFSGFSK